MLKHAVSILKNLVVPESDHAPAADSEKRIASLIRRATMLAAIKLDYQPVLRGSEIRNIGANRDLTTPFGRLQPAVSQEFHSAFSASVSAVRNARARALVPWESERWCGAIFDQ